MNNSYQKIDDKKYIVVDDKGIKKAKCEEDIGLILTLQNEIESNKLKQLLLEYKLLLYGDKNTNLVELTTNFLPAFIFVFTTYLASLGIAFPITFASMITLLQNKLNYYDTLENLKTKKEELLKEKKSLKKLIQVMQENLSSICEDSGYIERVELKKVQRK